jgi:hypothetical protein
MMLGPWSRGCVIARSVGCCVKSACVANGDQVNGGNHDLENAGNFRMALDHPPERDMDPRMTLPPEIDGKVGLAETSVLDSEVTDVVAIMGFDVAPPTILVLKLTLQQQVRPRAVVLVLEHRLEVVASFADGHMIDCDLHSDYAMLL